MKSVYCFAVVACAAITVHAEGVYIGAAVDQSYVGTVETTNGDQSTKADTGRARPFKALVGVNLNSNFGLEAGYKTFGKVRADVGDAAGTAVDMDARAFYIAGKGILPISENWDFTGKLGFAQRHFGVTLSTNGQSASESSDQATLFSSVGVAYKLTKNLSLTAELERMGTARIKNFSFGMDGLSAGLEWHF